MCFIAGLLAVAATADLLDATLGGEAVFWTAGVAGGLAATFATGRGTRWSSLGALDEIFALAGSSLIGGGLLAVSGAFALNAGTASGVQTVRVDVTGRCRSESRHAHSVTVRWAGREQNLAVAEDVYARVAIAPQALDLETAVGWLGLPIVRGMEPVPHPLELGRLPCERREG